MAKSQEQDQQRMLREAEKAAKSVSRTRQKERRTPQQADAPEEIYCVRCYAERANGQCPRCDQRKQVVSQFCKRCLRVHLSNAACRTWRPGA